MAPDDFLCLLGDDDGEARRLELQAALWDPVSHALFDYRDTFGLVPRPPDWEALVAADRAFFASQGGDANVGARLPALFDEARLEFMEIVPTTKYGHPHSAVWEWLTTYFLGVLDEYAAFPPFTPEAAQRIGAAWKDAATRSTSLLFGPTLLDLLGRKRA